MDCQAIENYSSPTLSWGVRLRQAIVRVLAPFGRNNSKLDLEIMSDYMKRDMGFMDGRDPRQEDEVTR